MTAAHDFEATDGACTATTQVAALETAGGVRGGTNGGTQATPPATDTPPVGLRGDHQPLSPIIPILLGTALLGAALVLQRARVRA